MAQYNHEEAQRQWQQHQQRAHQAQIEQQQQILKAQQQAQQRQMAIDQQQRQKYAVIAAVDQSRGFSKDGQIPWNYPEDFKWFQGKTKDHICIMGRKTYEDINARLGEKAAISVLPNRKCFVVSNTLTELPNAKVVKGIGEVELFLDEEDYDKIRFIIGGERLFNEGISLASEVYLTIINKDFECDKHFPVEFLIEHFDKDKMFTHEEAPDLRFTIWKRKETQHGQRTGTTTRTSS